MPYFYSPPEYNQVALSTNIEETKIILSKLSKVIYMTNQNTHGMRHIFSNLQSGFSLILPNIREDRKKLVPNPPHHHNITQNYKQLLT